METGSAMLLQGDICLHWFMVMHAACTEAQMGLAGSALQLGTALLSDTLNVPDLVWGYCCFCILQLGKQIRIGWLTYQFSQVVLLHRRDFGLFRRDRRCRFAPTVARFGIVVVSICEAKAKRHETETGCVEKMLSEFSKGFKASEDSTDPKAICAWT